MKRALIAVVAAAVLLTAVGASFAGAYRVTDAKEKKSLGNQYQYPPEVGTEPMWGASFDHKQWKKLAENYQIKAHVKDPASGFVKIELNIPSNYRFSRGDAFYKKGKDETGTYIDMVFLMKTEWGNYRIDRYWALCGSEKFRWEAMAYGAELTPDEVPTKERVVAPAPKKTFITPQKETAAPVEELRPVRNYLFGTQYLDYVDVLSNRSLEEAGFVDKAAYDAICGTNIRFLEN